MFIFAHRGASLDAPENTLLAMQIALEQQADGIEIDIQQIGNELIVLHDHHVDRTTNGFGQISHFNLAEIQAFDAGDGQFIPTLWQVLKLVNGQCVMNLELKSVYDISLVHKHIKRAITDLSFTPEQFLVSSFDHHLLAAFRVLAPHIHIGALTACKPINYAAFATELHAYSVNININFVDKDFVKDAKNRGLNIFVYTVDDPEEIIKLEKWGVDGIFSNCPAIARQVLASVNS